MNFIIIDYVSVRMWCDQVVILTDYHVSSDFIHQFSCIGVCKVEVGSADRVYFF